MRRTSKLAVVSLVLGILGFLIVPAVAGLICGIVAWIQINGNPQQLKGKGTAIAGTVLSGVMLLLIPVIALVAALILPALAKAKHRAADIQSLNQIKQITLALHLYANDSDNLLPATTNWCDAILQHTGNNRGLFLSPTDPHRQPQNHSSYAFNARIAGTKLSEAAPNTVLVFSTTSGGWNPSGGPDLLRDALRSGRSAAVGFADGHCESIRSESRLDSLHWDP